MKLYRIFTLIGLPAVLLLAGSSCSSREKRSFILEDPVLQVVDKYLDWEGENGFSGAILVKISGKEPLIKGYGKANDELGIPNDAEVAFSIGSLTKQFTGAAILKLQMMGKLSVKDSIATYLPGISPALGKITFHQLLTHTSGLPPDVGSNSDVITRDELWTRLQQITVSENLKGHYAYSHAGYNLLGLLIESISGSDYESFLQQYLFKPAGMKRTGYRIPDWTNSVVAHGYSYCNDWGRPMDSGWLEDGPSWNRRASGGMLSTVSDLYAWHLSLLSNAILDDSARRQYYYPEPSVNVRGNSTSGYGWLVLKSVRNSDAIAHNGWDGRFYADFLRYISEDVTIIVLSNQFRGGNENLSYEIAKCIFKHPYSPELMGRKTLCLDSLPDNRIGLLTRNFLDLLANGSESDFRSFIKQNIASHMLRKYTNEALVDSLHSLQKKSGSVKIRQVRLYDNRVLSLDVLQLIDNQEASFRLFFDENEDYRIRGISYSGKDERN